MLRSLEEAPNYEKAQTLLLTLYDARVRPNGGGGEAMSILRTLSLTALAVSSSPAAIGAARSVAAAAAAVSIEYFGSPDEFYTPPAFHGNPAYDGRFTFARIKYRGYEHWSAAKARAGRTTIRTPKRISRRFCATSASVRPFVEDGSDRRQRDRRARRSRCCSSIR